MPATVTLTIDERTRVAEAFDVTFTGHSHKISEHGESPLGVSLTVHRDGRDIQASEWLEVSEPGRPQFAVAGVTFEYVAHDYDRSIELKVVSVGPVTPPPNAPADVNEPDSPSELRRRRLPVTHTNALADVVIADLTRTRLIGIDARTNDRTVATVDVLLAEANALAAVNGTFFDEQLRPLGLLVSKGTTLSPMRSADWGVLLVGNDGAADLVHTKDFERTASLDFAVQCGPRMVIDGRPPKLKPQVARRTGLCIQDPRTVALFVVDLPVEANALAGWLAAPEGDEGLGCTDAVLLDGGPSTQLDEAGSDAHPTVAGGWGVPNAVGFIARDDR